MKKKRRKSKQRTKKQTRMIAFSYRLKDEHDDYLGVLVEMMKMIYPDRAKAFSKSWMLRRVLNVVKARYEDRILDLDKIK